ncbi:nitrate/nitrite transporter [Paeniglutamicibacter sp. NPDC012692]|uniref:MFS transporter n=1 Tax=Paeniglutamicibacter sp. NPDC012692 TaxID=3364388 RepID=UPI0036A7D2CF
MDYSLHAVPLHPATRRDRLKSTIGAASLVFCTSMIGAFGLLVPSGTKHFDVSVSAYLIHYTLLAGVSALMFGFLGKYAQKYGIRRFVIMGGFWTTICIFAMSATTNIYVFYVFSMLHGIGWAGCTLIAATIVVNGWHVHKRRGSVLGIVMAFMGLGGLLWGLVLPAIVTEHGWAGGMRTLAIAAFILLVLPGIFLIRNPPSATTTSEIMAPRVSPVLSLRAAGLTAPVALLMIGAFALALDGGVVQVLPMLFQNSGVDAARAGILVSFSAICGIMSKPVLGIIYDKLGVRSASAIAGLAFIIGFPWLTLASGFTSYLVIIPLISLALTTFTVMVPMVISDAVGPQRFSVVYGRVMMVCYLGLAVATPLWGLSFDVTGSFDLALISAAAMGAIGMVILLIGFKKARQKSDRSIDVELPNGAAIE